MTKYFKGNIINVNNLPDYKYSLNIIKTRPDCQEHYYLLDNTSHQFLLYFKKYSGSELKKLVKLLRDIITFNNNENEKQELDKKVISLFSETPNNVSGYPIIFEKLYDEDGNEYGKELLSGSVFPINNKFSSYDVNYSLRNPDEKIYYEADTEKGYTLKKEYMGAQGYYYYFVDFDGNAIKILKDDYYTIKNMWTGEKKEVYFNNKFHNFVVCDEPFYFNICLIPKIIFPSNQRVDYCLSGEKIASELEVNNYLNKFSYGFRKKRNRLEYEGKINYFASSNYLGEVNFVSGNIVNNRVSEGALTHEMQELEFLLFRLKSVSPEDYDILNKEYLKILNQNDNELHIHTLSLNSIIALQNRANLAYMCHGGNSKSIIAYLESQVDLYLENYNDGEIEKTKLTLSDLDKLSSNFLNSKNSYTIKEQNAILRCLSLLYFFEIHENKDILNSNDLKNSYVADNIKRILVIIGVLHDCGVIKDIPNSLYDISNLDEFLDFIKEIKLSDLINETGNQLIKKMQL